MTIFCRVQVVPESMPAFVDEQRLETLAAIQFTQHKKQEAEKIAQECADTYGYIFEVIHVTERLHGRYKPKGKAT